MRGRDDIANALPAVPTESSDIPNYNSEIFRSPRSHRATLSDVTFVLREVFHNNRTSLLALANVSLVVLCTFLVTRMFDTECISDAGIGMEVGEAKAFCDPYRPLDRVVVDVDLNTSSHCYSSKSCVALGDSLRKDHGKFRYNFIIGAYGFVYNENGYKCQTEELEDALYIRLPVDSIYYGQDFMAAHKAVGKFAELLREGLECGKVLPNYTLTATGCGGFNSWCTQMLHELISENPGDRTRGGGAGVGGPRAPRFDQTTPGGFFNPLNLNRVYGYQYKLVACTKTGE